MGLLVGQLGNKGWESLLGRKQRLVGHRLLGSSTNFIISGWGCVLMLRYIQSLLGDRILEARGMPPTFLDIVAAFLIILGG